MDTFIQVFISWFPMIILIGVWIFFMRKMKGPQNQTIIYLEKQNKLMKEYIKVSERIAVSLEKISERSNK